jgi:23S rRNA (cytidine2498-2'-O)-methyltransferase
VQPVTVAYLSADGYETQLHDELRAAGITTTMRHGRLVLSDDPARSIAWAINTWLEVEYLPISSIREAGDALRQRGRNWAAYLPLHRGRGALIAERLPYVSARPLAMGAPAPTAPLGSWTLLTPNLMVAAARCTSAFPNGEAEFVEDRTGPPSRAYLKLWEAFVRLGRWPQPGERCLDLGASPGGWTWALAALGAHVIAVDKAPLDPSVSAQPNVEFRSQSAFALEPSTFGAVDWLCSDVIAYPQRTYALVQRWLTEGQVRNIVVTVKLQGETDHHVLGAFAGVDGATLTHLHHNKHELTFLLAR